MKIEAEWMRGGTSKCWVFETGQLDETGTSPDVLLPRLFGSPDHRQIDGVGGATSTTSKAMILHRPADAGVDVEFTFAQVGIEEAAVDWGSNCGNCSAVVGLYAIEKGWVVPTGDVTRIVTRNTNTGQVIIQRVSTPAGALPIVPQAQMPGVPFPGYRVGLGFLDPAGKTTGRLLPTGSATDTIVAGGTRWTVSMVDAGAPVVMLRAEDLGLDPERYGSWPAGLELQLDTLEHIRRQAAVRMGLAATPGEAARAVPKVAVVAAPAPSDAEQRRRRRHAVDGQAAPGPGHHRKHRPDPRGPHPGHAAGRHHRRHRRPHPAAAHPGRGHRNLERGTGRVAAGRRRPHRPHHRHHHHPPSRGPRHRRRRLLCQRYSMRRQHHD